MEKSRDVRSPISSSIYASRVEEKEDLSDLNDRLAVYIDRMRSQEQQNQQLSVEASQTKVTYNQKVVEVKALYERELAAARNLIDETAKENAELKMENQKLNGIVDDTTPKLKEQQALLSEAQEKIIGLERSLKEKETVLIAYATERSSQQKRLNEAEYEIQELESKLAADKDELEKEVIARIDAENRCQTLREKIEFYQQVEGDKIVELRAEAEKELRPQLEKLDRKNKELQDIYEDLQVEFNVLVDSKTTLDKELEEYNSLLSQEEERLNQDPETQMRRNPRKRPRLAADETEDDNINTEKEKPSSSSLWNFVGSIVPGIKKTSQ